MTAKRTATAHLGTSLFLRMLHDTCVRCCGCRRVYPCLGSSVVACVQVPRYAQPAEVAAAQEAEGPKGGAKKGKKGKRLTVGEDTIRVP